MARERGGQMLLAKEDRGQCVEREAGGQLASVVGIDWPPGLSD